MQSFGDQIVFTLKLNSRKFYQATKKIGEDMDVHTSEETRGRRTLEVTSQSVGTKFLEINSDKDPRFRPLV